MSQQVSVNLANYNRAMTSNSRQTTKSVGSFYDKSKSFKTRVLDNNVHGKRLDQITVEQSNTNVNGKLTNYASAFGDAKSPTSNVVQTRAPQIAVTDSKAIKATTSNAQAIQRAQSQKDNVSLKQVNFTNDNANNGVIVHKHHEVEPTHQHVHEHGKYTPHGTQKAMYGSIYNAQSIREEMKKAFMANPFVTVNDEAEYYETIRRLDVCGHCWADQIKYYTAPFKCREKGPGLTLYQKDYVKHPLDSQGPKINNDFYNTFNIEEPMDMGTTMRNDYKPWKVGPVDRPTNNGKSGASGIPFGGRAGYRADYIDWGKMPVEFEKAPNKITVISELPFVGKTAYNNDYEYRPAEQSRPVDRDLLKHKRSPLPPGIPFLGETTHNKTFKPFRIGNAPMFNVKDDYEPTEAYPDQYKTLYQQDYTGPAKWKCPARIFMDTHTHPKFKTLKI